MQVKLKTREDKITGIKRLLKECHGNYQKKVSLRQLWSLPGTLNFACRAAVAYLTGPFADG